MNSLRDFQERCYRAFLLGDGGPLLPSLREGNVPARTSIQVYQNNAIETYRKALLASYPVVERLVGDACFRGIANKFMRDYPSTSGDLQNFGLKLPDFLNELYAKTDFAYLPDVARLEWALEEVQLNKASEVLNVDALARISPDRLVEIRFLRSETTKLIGSAYPILSIWRTNQPEHEADVDLSSGAEHVVVRRHAENIEMNLIDAPAAALAELLHGRHTLEEAIAEMDPVITADPGFDLGALLQQLIATGLISSFLLEDRSPSQ